MGRKGKRYNRQLCIHTQIYIVKNLAIFVRAIFIKFLNKIASIFIVVIKNLNKTLFNSLINDKIFIKRSKLIFLLYEQYAAIP